MPPPCCACPHMPMHLCINLHCALHNPVCLPLSHHHTPQPCPPAGNLMPVSMTPFSSLGLDSKAQSTTSSKLQDHMSECTEITWVTFTRGIIKCPSPFNPSLS